MAGVGFGACHTLLLRQVGSSELAESKARLRCAASMLLPQHHGANAAIHTSGNLQEAARRLFAPRQRQCRSSPVRIVSTAQVLESELESRIQSHHNASTTAQQRISQSDRGSTARDMSSGIHVPRHKVLTTNMIAQATNKDIEQVYNRPAASSPDYSQAKS